MCNEKKKKKEYVGVKKIPLFTKFNTLAPCFHEV